MNYAQYRLSPEQNTAPKSESVTVQIEKRDMKATAGKKEGADDGLKDPNLKSRNGGF